MYNVDESIGFEEGIEKVPVERSWWFFPKDVTMRGLV